jgi:hypothetical protein
MGAVGFWTKKNTIRENGVCIAFRVGYTVLSMVILSCLVLRFNGKTVPIQCQIYAISMFA